MLIFRKKQKNDKYFLKNKRKSINIFKNIKYIYRINDIVVYYVCFYLNLLISFEMF